MNVAGMRLPIVQAPMAGVSTPQMAAAVTNAGALGSLAIGAMTAPQAREVIRATRALTPGVFNVNAFCHAPARRNEAAERRWLDWLAPSFAEFGASAPQGLREIYRSFLADDAMLEVLLEERPRLVSFHFGLPRRDAIDALRSAGILLMATVTNLDEAALAADAGMDALVAQGIEAGGHRGVFDPGAPDEGLGVIALTRLLVRRCRLPVIAAGGIMDGAGIAAVLGLGAQAAQLGTAFIACPESSADEGYRSALLGEGALHTRLTAAISGRPARGMVNRITRLGDAKHRPDMPDYPVAYDAAKALHTAAKARGESGFGAHWAGQGAPLARSLAAADLVSRLEREWRESSAA